MLWWITDRRETTLPTAGHDVRIIPQTPRLGALVEGVDPRRPLGDEVVERLKAALFEYKVLFFRELHLTREEHIAFATRFGDVWKNPSGFLKYSDDGIGDIVVVEGFHADAMYLPSAPAFSMLRMLELPEVGGDTIWADLVSSYADLSETFREFLETLTVYQRQQIYDLPDEDFARAIRSNRSVELSKEELSEIRRSLAPSEAPLVRVIPETGAKNYWISAQDTQSIKGLSREESDAVLGVLFRHQLQPQYIYRWRWLVGDLAFWDNRTTLHSGIADYGNEKRSAQRVSVHDNRPLGPAALANRAVPDPVRVG